MRLFSALAAFAAVMILATPAAAQPDPSRNCVNGILEDPDGVQMRNADTRELVPCVATILPYGSVATVPAHPVARAYPNAHPPFDYRYSERNSIHVSTRSTNTYNNDRSGRNYARGVERGLNLAQEYQRTQNLLPPGYRDGTGNPVRDYRNHRPHVRYDRRNNQPDFDRDDFDRPDRRRSVRRRHFNANGNAVDVRREHMRQPQASRSGSPRGGRSRGTGRGHNNWRPRR